MTSEIQFQKPAFCVSCKNTKVERLAIKNDGSCSRNFCSVMKIGAAAPLWHRAGQAENISDKGNINCFPGRWLGWKKSCGGEGNMTCWYPCMGHLIPTKDLMKKYHENSQLVDSIVAAKDMNPHYIINMVHNLQKKNIYIYVHVVQNICSRRKRTPNMNSIRTALPLACTIMRVGFESSPKHTTHHPCMMPHHLRSWRCIGAGIPVLSVPRSVWPNLWRSARMPRSAMLMLQIWCATLRSWWLSHVSCIPTLFNPHNLLHLHAQIKVEPVEHDATFLHDPNFAWTTETECAWPTWCESGTWGTKAQTKTEAQDRQQQAPKGEDTSSRSQGRFFDSIKVFFFFIMYWIWYNNQRPIMVCTLATHEAMQSAAHCILEAKSFSLAGHVELGHSQIHYYVIP